VAKIREYFLQRINQFKKPLANYQVPQNGILRFKFYFHFLQAGLEKTRVFKKKSSPVFFFCFLGFFWDFWFLYIYLPRREFFLGFFQFQEYF
jgi:hypothetical protein